MGIKRIAVIALAMLLAGCLDLTMRESAHQTGSVVDFLYPGAKQAPQMRETVTTLRPPVTVGIAFVPGGAAGFGAPSEAEKLALLEKVKASFTGFPYIGRIEIIPTQYLRPQGGFENLDQVARMFDVEVVALVSYDQLQFTGNNAASILYWSIIGAYIIPGDNYDVHTMIDVSVFDVASRKLLFRAPGTSRAQGESNMIELPQNAREARMGGYGTAVSDLLPRLHAELDRYRERIKTEHVAQVENKPGYSGGGGADAGWLLLAVTLFAAGWRGRRAA